MVSRFPVTTETFILRELNGLEERGEVAIELFALFRAHGETVQESALRWTDRVRRPRRARLLADVTYWFARSPRTSARIVGTVVADHLRRPPVLIRALVTAAYGAQLARTSERLGLDQLHAHFATYPALAAWVVRELTGTPYTVTAHAHDLYFRRAGLARRLRGASAVVSISHYNRGYVQAIAGPSVPTPLVRNGIDLRGARFKAPEENRGENLRIVVVGSLRPVKGHRVLLDALAGAPAPLSDCTVTFVGDGPLRGELAARVRELELESRVVFLGALASSEVGAVLEQADVLVQPSLSEGLPTTMVEAMAVGVPVIGTDVTGVPELIDDGVTGLLARAGDPLSLRDALVRVAREPSLCTRMAIAARARIESEYELGHSLEALTRVLRSVCPTGPR